jgi:hypothetical protein
VAVEKVGFSEKSRKSGDRKCPGDWEKSFAELPVAIQFLQIPSERVFQQPQDLSTSIRAKASQPICKKLVSDYTTCQELTNSLPTT